jgi:glycosyltransferase involved in cell wall biosynthesis
MRLPSLTLALPQPSVDRILRLPGRRADAVRRRFRILVGALGIPTAADAEPIDALPALEQRLATADADEIWLTLAVLRGSLPEAPEVVRAVRTCRLDGPRVALDVALGEGWLGQLPGAGSVPDVEVITGQVLVDLEHTSRTELATGIQRVARMTASRWARDHDIVLVGWTADQRALRRLGPHEASRALTGSTQGLEPSDGDAPDTVVIPWRTTYVLPELAPEGDRTRRLLALARFSRCHTGVIGFDCVPISSAETTDNGVSEAFAGNLAAVRHFGRVAAISGAAAEEYRGWRHMLAAIGERGPDIQAVSLPVEAYVPSATSLVEARERLIVGGLPLVLCVGTHEPRKNHLAVLHAAEVLWRRGLRFSLAFIGGHSWNSQRFDARVAQLRAAGRPIELLTSITDESLWAAYRVSHCVLFPSLNEGFGLPVAEALACGTPVVTSNFGSMAEIAELGGAVLVDPRDDSSLTEGLARVLTDVGLHARLRTQATARPQRSWDDYARETWDLLVTERQTRP